MTQCGYSGALVPPGIEFSTFYFKNNLGKHVPFYQFFVLAQLLYIPLMHVDTFNLTTNLISLSFNIDNQC